MSNIVLLDQSTINQIAAGEVIDRPSSIVKELMENSIDAGATSVTVEIKDGGTKLIRITDNGRGIDKSDVKIAFLRHATSKIKSVEDLMTVSSLGFRGEALSSIAAVCQVELISKTADSFTGIKYNIEGGVEKDFSEIGAPDGTTFLVRNIFFNTPARRKFLKSPQTEAGYISDVVEKIALSHPDLSVNFINNGQPKIHTAGNGNLKDVIYAIYGREVTNNLIEIYDETSFGAVYGFIGKPLISKGNRSFENYFINGRFIKSGIITKAIEEGFSSVMMQHKYPFTALHFNIDSQLLDVNVHPAKMELRFKNGNELFPWIVDVISDSIIERPKIPEVHLVEEDKEVEIIKKAPEPFEQKRMEKEVVQNTNKSFPTQTFIKEQELDNTNTNNTDDNNIINENKSITKTNYFGNTIVESNNNENSKVFATLDNYSDSINQQKETISENGSYLNETQNKETNEPSVIIDNSTPFTNIKKTSKDMTMNLFDDDFLTEKAKKKHRIIGQIFKTYWIVEYEDKMYVIDQHAAHEKVMYEKIMTGFKNKEANTQMIAPPIILSLSMSETELLNRYLENFREIGYEIESFGGQDFAVRGIPADLYALDSNEVLMNLIDNLSEQNTKISSQLITEKIASMSCKAAVKGNNEMSYEEADSLIDQMLKLENPFNCPHGRPTTISFSKQEMDKKFKRII